MPSIIYLLRNPVFDDLIKIGRTDNDLKQRIDELSRFSGVPARYECVYACEVEDGKSVEIEKNIHFAFGDHRINPKREFFKVNPERVKRMLQMVATREVFVEDDGTEDMSDMIKSTKRRASVNMFMLGIPNFATLQFVRDESITCTVVDGKKIDFNGEITSLSASAARVLGYDKLDPPRPVTGTEYWMYEGETIKERRDRLESSDDDLADDDVDFMIP